MASLLPQELPKYKQTKLLAKLFAITEANKYVCPKNQQQGRFASLFIQ